LEELNQEGIKLGPFIISEKLKYELALDIWGLPRNYPKNFVMF